jgi:hypothetical protein
MKMRVLEIDFATPLSNFEVGKNGMEMIQLEVFGLKPLIDGPAVCDKTMFDSPIFWF